MMRSWKTLSLTATMLSGLMLAAAAPVASVQAAPLPPVAASAAAAPLAAADGTVQLAQYYRHGYYPHRRYYGYHRYYGPRYGYRHYYGPRYGYYGGGYYGGGCRVVRVRVWDPHWGAYRWRTVRRCW